MTKGLPSSRSLGEELLAFQCKVTKLDPQPERQFRFAPTRLWTFDFAWPEQRLAIEVQGGIYLKGRNSHAGIDGYERDREKILAAQELGWIVAEFTTRQVKQGAAINWIDRILKARRRQAANAAG